MADKQFGSLIGDALSSTYSQTVSGQDPQNVASLSFREFFLKLYVARLFLVCIERFPVVQSERTCLAFGFPDLAHV